ncbi:MAG: S-methyl-5'-thioinosine phosphorylase [Cellvibrionaceae bacterium]|nr:S-methyl-5'-thioinosine phosphorylase [Cellvibrionaceae bacterium]
MSLIAIIGGSGFEHLMGIQPAEFITQDTPYGVHSQPVVRARLGQVACIFIPRHGGDHQLPPHKVNYRANLWLLHKLGVKRVIACNVVGGISTHMSPMTLLLPHQIIDYTYGRQHTFFDGEQNTSFLACDPPVQHIDFSSPYCLQLRKQISTFFTRENITFVGGGVYGCTQGPRLETAAEIERMKRDGCDVVGMTAMPEAGLARELSLAYISLSLVVNWAAGIEDQIITLEKIMCNCTDGMNQIKGFLPALLQFIDLDH